MTNTNITNLRKNIFDYANSCIEYNDVICVNAKGGNVVMISEEEYRGILATLELMSNAVVAQSIVDGMNSSADELEEFGWDD